LRFNFSFSGTPVKIIGNLPFNIASPLLLQFLRAYSPNQGLEKLCQRRSKEIAPLHPIAAPFHDANTPTDLTLAFQKEVAEVF
jgi:16S rRNA A1518/A1519 N6-dimethyltransferase RsmA/KsgA/DIM1 with predicted DNA glycosylase/AP lyase activity